MSVLAQRPRIRNAILIGGFIAGSFDLICAFLTYGWGVPRGIAGGLLGRQVIAQGGTATWILGVFLHYFIAYAAAAVYAWTSLRLAFLKEHFLICGLMYGMAFYLVMKLIVVPLSGLHSVGPFTLRDLIQGLLVHMILIGLPIAICVRRFSR